LYAGTVFGGVIENINIAGGVPIVVEDAGVNR
jgi:hypothetical protein